MKTLHLITVSNAVPAWAGQAEDFYRRQLRFFQLSVVAIRPATPEKEADAVLRRVDQARKTAKAAALPVVLFDVAGQALDSTTFSTALPQWLQANARFVIAGAAGASPKLHQRADEKISLSPLTFPHTLARLIVVEQLFRADCALRNHPYPR